MNKIRNTFISYVKEFKSIAISSYFIKWILWSCILGLLTGAACTLFLKSLTLATSLRLKYTWFLYFLPFIGALISFLYKKYGKNSSKGNNLIIDQVHKNDEAIPFRMAPLVSLCAFMTHLFGGSAGREGVGVQIGGSIADWLGRKFRVDSYDRKILLLSGISSGFGSIFGTPLAGTIFGLEVVSIGSMSYEAIIPCFTASLLGSLTTSFLGIHHVQRTIDYIPEFSLIVIVKVILASIIFGLTSTLFAELTHFFKDFFSKHLKNPMIKTFIGGIIIILLTLIVGTRDYLGLSLPLLENSFKEQVSPLAFLWKIIFTSLTLGSGFQGGEVTPLFIIGSTLGNALSPVFNLPMTFLAALGFIAVFCGATNAPITCLILSIEVFGSDSMIYMFIACLVSYLFSGYSGVYTAQRISSKKYKYIDIPEDASIETLKQLGK